MVYVGVKGDAPDLSAYKIIQLPENHVLIPGLINCHTHSPMTLLRGFADDLPLIEWLTQYIWPAEKEFVDPDFVTLSSELGKIRTFYAGIQPCKL